MNSLHPFWKYRINEIHIDGQTDRWMGRQTDEHTDEEPEEIMPSSP